MTCQIHSNGTFGVESAGGAEVDIATSSRVHSNKSGNISGSIERSSQVPLKPSTSLLEDVAPAAVQPPSTARLTAASLAARETDSRPTAASLFDPAREAAVHNRRQGDLTARSAAAAHGAAAEVVRPVAKKRQVPQKRGVKPMSAAVCWCYTRGCLTGGLQVALSKYKAMLNQFEAQEISNFEQVAERLLWCSI